MERQYSETARSNPDRVATDAVVRERLHPTLRDNYIPLPEAGIKLTDEQVTMIFSGDLTALQDVIQFARHTAEDWGLDK